MFLLFKGVFFMTGLTLSNGYSEIMKLHLKFCVALCDAFWNSYAKK